MQLKGLSGGNFVTGLDIGTSSIKVVVAERRGGKPTLVHAAKIPCFGMRKGAIVEMSEASQSVSRARGALQTSARPRHGDR